MYRKSVIQELNEMIKLLADQKDRTPVKEWQRIAEMDIRLDALKKAAIVLQAITDKQFTFMCLEARRKEELEIAKATKTEGKLTKQLPLIGE